MSCGFNGYTSERYYDAEVIMGWKLSGTKKFAYKGTSSRRPFKGSAKLYTWDGKDPAVKKNHPHFAVVATIVGYEGSAVSGVGEVWAGSQGFLADAVKEAFPALQTAKFGGSASAYTDWGDPIGTPSDYDWDTGTGVLMFRDPRRASANLPVSKLGRILAEEGLVPATPQGQLP